MESTEQFADCCENRYSHSLIHERLEQDIISRLEKIKDLPEDEKDKKLLGLPLEVYDDNGGMFDMGVIQDLINSHIRSFVKWT